MSEHPAEVSQLWNWGAQSAPSLLTGTASLGGVRDSRHGGLGGHHEEEKLESRPAANESRQMAFRGECNCGTIK